MSNIIDFLEKMGRDAQLRHASKSEVELALANAHINPELQTAILAQDQPQLEALLRAGINCCYFLANDGQDDEFSREQCA